MSLIEFSTLAALRPGAGVALDLIGGTSDTPTEYRATMRPTDWLHVPTVKLFLALGLISLGTPREIGATRITPLLLTDEGLAVADAMSSVGGV